LDVARAVVGGADRSGTSAGAFEEGGEPCRPPS
jgi:hypothetical protein